MWPGRQPGTDVRSRENHSCHSHTVGPRPRPEHTDTAPQPSGAVPVSTGAGNAARKIQHLFLILKIIILPENRTTGNSHHPMGGSNGPRPADPHTFSGEDRGFPSQPGAWRWPPRSPPHSTRPVGFSQQREEGKCVRVWKGMRHNR